MQKMVQRHEVVQRNEPTLAKRTHPWTSLRRLPPQAGPARTRPRPLRTDPSGRCPGLGDNCGLEPEWLAVTLISRDLGSMCSAHVTTHSRFTP